MTAPCSVGVLGMGVFGARLARSLAASGVRARLVLSERGRHSGVVAAELGCSRLPNDQLVHQCDLVVLCVPGEEAQPCIERLPWRAGQVMVSSCATVPLHLLSSACHPAMAVRALPLPGAPGASCSLLWPDEPRARSVLSFLGTVLVMPDEQRFAAGCAAACLQAWSHQLAAWTAAWAERRGLGTDAARTLLAASLQCAGTHLRESSGSSFTELLAGTATPGGLSEAGLRVLAAAGAGVTWSEALEAALMKACGQR